MHALPATTLDRRHEWTEPSVIALPGALLEQPHPDWQVMALDISRRLGLRTVVRITDGTWEVLSLGDAPPRRFAVVASAACSLTRDDEHRCPMQLAPQAGEYCSMRGGPWTSSSIHAAAGWRDQRNRCGRIRRQRNLQVKLAFSTNAYLRYPFAEAVASLAKIGYAGVEIMADVPHAWPAYLLPAQKQAIRNSLKENRVAISNINAFMMHAIDDPRQKYWHPSWIEPDLHYRRIRVEHTKKH